MKSYDCTDCDLMIECINRGDWFLTDLQNDGCLKKEKEEEKNKNV